VSGLLTAIVYLDSISDLWTGIYGRTLVIKLLLFGVVAGLGAYNWRRLKPTIDQPKTVVLLRRSARTELVIAGVTLAVTAVLVALPLVHE
jgi:putative copper export protein